MNKRDKKLEEWKNRTKNKMSGENKATEPAESVKPSEAIDKEIESDENDIKEAKPE